MMANERLRKAMVRAGVDLDRLADAAQVDVKTVQRWLAGRIPHPRHRITLASLLGEEEGYLWPAASPDTTPGADSTSEIVSAYAHRSDIPSTKWIELLARARRHIDLLGYAFLFLPEQHADLAASIRKKCDEGCHVRILTAEPAGTHVAERDNLEGLGGTLPARINMTLHHLEPILALPGVELRFHNVHLYNAVYRFDDEMIVTPYLYRAHGYQHPALHIRRLGPYGIFANFLEEYDTIWASSSATSALVESPPSVAGA